MIQILAAALLSAALAMPRPHGDTESTADRAERLETIATAIAIEAHAAPEWRWSTQDLAWLLFATAYEESGRFRLDVHAGTKLGDNGRARCLAQVHAQRLVPRAEWLSSTGVDLDATRTCFRIAARLLVASSRCVSRGRALDALQVARIAASYGTGRTCQPLKSSWRRAHRWARLRSEWQLPPAGIPPSARYALLGL